MGEGVVSKYCTVPNIGSMRRGVSCREVLKEGAELKVKGGG